MRLATYNVEWFAHLFDSQDRLIVDDDWSGRRDVTRAQQIESLGKVFVAMDADAILVIEAPDTVRRQSTVRALEHFAAAFDLRTSAAVTGFPTETQQEIALLYDPKVMTARHDPKGNNGTTSPRFDGEFRIDLDIDATEDLVRFSKPPLELEVALASGGRLRLIGAHLKSKSPHGARSQAGVMRLSIANRRKQLAQAIWMRARISEHLALGDPLIVLGDLNDGPGLDAYEDLFGRSSVEIVLGDDLYDPHAHQALIRRLGAAPTTARFKLKGQDRYLQALLDYIMVSPDLMTHNPVWRIWHPFDDERCWQLPELREALLLASDHFPVTLDIDL